MSGMPWGSVGFANLFRQFTNKDKTGMPFILCGRI